jgi:hypothetical protein
MSDNFTQSVVMFVAIFVIDFLFSLVGALILRTPREKLNKIRLTLVRLTIKIYPNQKYFTKHRGKVCPE